MPGASFRLKSLFFCVFDHLWWFLSCTFTCPIRYESKTSGLIEVVLIQLVPVQVLVPGTIFSNDEMRGSMLFMNEKQVGFLQVSSLFLCLAAKEYNFLERKINEKTCTNNRYKILPVVF